MPTCPQCAHAWDDTPDLEGAASLRRDVTELHQRVTTLRSEMRALRQQLQTKDAEWAALATGLVQMGAP